MCIKYMQVSYYSAFLTISSLTSNKEPRTDHILSGFLIPSTSRPFFITVLKAEVIANSAIRHELDRDCVPNQSFYLKNQGIDFFKISDNTLEILTKKLFALLFITSCEFMSKIHFYSFQGWNLRL